MSKITLATLAEATAQQVFDQVATHMLEQAETSYSSTTDMCAYRGDNGLMCAAGCLIADDEYLTGMDVVGGGWGELVDKGYVETDAHETLICALQDMHDNMHDDLNRNNQAHVRRKWREQLHDLADNHGLSPEVLAK